MNTKIADISPEDMKYHSPKVITVIIVLLCFISRVPQLISPYLLLDGDECLVGIMAKHIYDGKELPLFFWGQQYGFTLIECLMILPFYAVFGMKAVAVKLAILSLWTIGVVFLYKTLQLLNKNHPCIPFLLILVFIWHPAWAIWAMKARGGYITAFTLSNITLYLCLQATNDKTNWRYIIIGLLLALIYESHPFWLTGVIPVLLYNMVMDKKRGAAIAMWGIAAILVFMLGVFKQGLVAAYTPPTIIPGIEQAWNYTLRIPEFLYVSLHGNYYFSFIQNPNFFCAFAAILFEILLFGLFVTGVVFLFLRKKNEGLFIVSIIFIPLCIGVTLFSPDIQGRYLLPVTGFLLLPLQLLLNKVRRVRFITVSAAIYTAVGIIALSTFWNFEFLSRRKDTVFTAIKYLQENNVKYVFCTDGMVSWQIIFYTQENIISRVPYIPERYPFSAGKIDEAYLAGEKTAVVCHAGELIEFNTQNPQQINDFGIGLYPKL